MKVLKRGRLTLRGLMALSIIGLLAASCGGATKESPPGASRVAIQISSPSLVTMLTSGSHRAGLIVLPPSSNANMVTSDSETSTNVTVAVGFQFPAGRRLR